MSKTYPATLKTAEQQITTKPAYGYRIEYDAANSGPVYYLTDFDEDVTVTGMPAAKGSDPQVFTATQIKHRMPEQTMSLTTRQAAIAVAVTDTELRKYSTTTPTRIIGVEIYRFHTVNLPGAVAWANDVYTELIGEGGATGFTGDYQINLSVAPKFLRQDGKIARFCYQKLCNYQLGGAGCGINLEAQTGKTATVLTGVSRLNRTADIASTQIKSYHGPPGTLEDITATTFEGGKMKMTDGTTVAIVSTTLLSPGVRLRLQWWPLSLAVSDAVTIYRGCRHTVAACESDFNNKPNFGGTPGIPFNNPAIDGVDLGR